MYIRCIYIRPIFIRYSHFFEVSQFFNGKNISAAGSGREKSAALSTLDSTSL